MFVTPCRGFRCDLAAADPADLGVFRCVVRFDHALDLGKLLRRELVKTHQVFELCNDLIRRLLLFDHGVQFLTELILAHLLFPEQLDILFQFFGIHDLQTAGFMVGSHNDQRFFRMCRLEFQCCRHSPVEGTDFTDHPCCVVVVSGVVDPAAFQHDEEAVLVSESETFRGKGQVVANGDPLVRAGLLVPVHIGLAAGIDLVHGDGGIVLDDLIFCIQSRLDRLAGIDGVPGSFQRFAVSLFLRRKSGIIEDVVGIAVEQEAAADKIHIGLRQICNDLITHGAFFLMGVLGSRSGVRKSAGGNDPDSEAFFPLQSGRETFHRLFVFVNADRAVVGLDPAGNGSAAGGGVRGPAVDFIGVRGRGDIAGVHHELFADCRFCNSTLVRAEAVANENEHILDLALGFILGTDRRTGCGQAESTEHHEGEKMFQHAFSFG